MWHILPRPRFAGLAERVLELALVEDSLALGAPAVVVECQQAVMGCLPELPAARVSAKANLKEPEPERMLEAKLGRFHLKP